MRKGSCSCGAVAVEIAGDLEFPPEACHCGQCRKQSSSFLAGVNVRRSALTVHGADNVTWYQSSDKVRRGFCSACGSFLFWDPVIAGYQYTSVSMGLLDQPTHMKIGKHTFVRDKGDYYDIGGDAEQREEF